MKKILLLVHALVVCAFIGSIFGIGFGIINTNTDAVRNYQETLCYSTNYSQSTYNYCYTMCNTTIPSCKTLLHLNVSGSCYNETNNISTALNTNCYVLCDIYIILQIIFQYTLTNNQIMTQTVIYDCKNNQTCIDKLTTNQVTCYYDIRNPSSVTLLKPISYRWEFISIIVVLCLLLLFYILINVTVFKKYNFNTT